VVLPNDVAKILPRTRLLTESEWRNLGVQQSPDWVHYMIHLPGNIRDIITLNVTLNLNEFYSHRLQNHTFSSSAAPK
jgi:cyclin-dependent kinase regulatory subunit CKS1